MAACILWIIYGALGILGGLTSIGVSKVMGISQTCIGAAFLITGIQVLMGKATSVLASGIVCVILAAVGLLGVMMLMSAMPRGAGGFGAMFLPIVLLNSALLLTSGILAIVGNGKFKAWRVAKGL